MLLKPFLPEPRHLHYLSALEDQGVVHHLSIVGMGQEAAGLLNPDFFLYPNLFLQLSLSFSRFFFLLDLVLFFNWSLCINQEWVTIEQKSFKVSFLWKAKNSPEEELRRRQLTQHIYRGRGTKQCRVKPSSFLIFWSIFNSGVSASKQPTRTQD